MPWCPRCRSEYRTGFYNCADCGTELKEGNLPVEHHQTAGERWARLVNVYDDNEAQLVAGMLKSAGIPVLMKSQGAGGYMRIVMGTELGVNLYVPESALNTARKIIQQEEVDVPPTESDYLIRQTSSKEDTPRDGKLLIKVFLLLVFIGPFLYAILKSIVL